MTIIPNFIIVGDKGIGKGQFIQQIIKKKLNCKLFAIVDRKIKFIRINNFYRENRYKFLFPNYYRNLEKGVILANALNITSIESIPIWYEKLVSMYPNLHVHIIVFNHCSQSMGDNLQLLHNTMQFCCNKNIKIDFI
jgi:hypothetical protein